MHMVVHVAGESLNAYDESYNLGYLYRNCILLLRWVAFRRNQLDRVKGRKRFLIFQKTPSNYVGRATTVPAEDDAFTDHGECKTWKSMGRGGGKLGEIYTFWSSQVQASSSTRSKTMQVST